MGLAYLAWGRLDEAIATLRLALALDPSVAQARNQLAMALTRRGRPGEAITEYREILKSDPASAEAHNALAWLLATSPSAEFRNGPEAIRLAKRAFLLSGESSAAMLDTLAAAYAESGRFDEAIETEERAIALLSAPEQESLRSGFEERMARYARRTPHRESP